MTRWKSPANPCNALPDDRRTHTVTRKHLEDALEVLSNMLSASLRSVGTTRPRAEGEHDREKSHRWAPATPVVLVERLAELALHADTVADIARTLSAERGDDAGAEMLACVEAVRASIQSHQRDLERLMPWAKLIASDAASALGANLHADLLPEQAFEPVFDTVPTLADLPNRCEAAILALARRRTAPAAHNGANGDSFVTRVDSLIDALGRSASAARALKERLEALADLTKKMFEAMEFGFLFDPSRYLLSIGYRVTEPNLDPNCYDLLGSEARLASFVAIAKGDVPARHWFRLGRTVTPVDGGSALLSWSGSMFEYLMPSLVMRAPAGCLLEQTNRLVVSRQMEYGDELGLPWGVSESAYNAQDQDLTYQYSSFGVPGLGLKRGLSDNAVVAPYATALAAMVDPHAAVRNFSRLAAAGSRGRYGQYEALDYTPAACA